MADAMIKAPERPRQFPHRLLHATSVSSETRCWPQRPTTQKKAYRYKGRCHAQWPKVADAAIEAGKSPCLLTYPMEECP